jgi:hypothetical protein
LKKKHNANAYHLIREAIAARIMRFAYIKSEENVSDVLTKPLSNEKFHYLMKRFNLKISGHEIKVKVAMRETSGQRCDSRKFSFCFMFGILNFNIIKITSISGIQILRHIPFFKLTLEYLEYIL